MNHLAEQGELRNFALYGGSGDGGMVIYPMQQAGGIYLVKIGVQDKPGLFEVWAYAHNGKVDKRGNLLLECERFIGLQGDKEAMQEGGAV